MPALVFSKERRCCQSNALTIKQIRFQPEGNRAVYFFTQLGNLLHRPTPQLTFYQTYKQTSNKLFIVCKYLIINPMVNKK